MKDVEMILAEHVPTDRMALELSDVRFPRLGNDEHVPGSDSQLAQGHGGHVVGEMRVPLLVDQDDVRIEPVSRQQRDMVVRDPNAAQRVPEMLRQIQYAPVAGGRRAAPRRVGCRHGSRSESEMLRDNGSIR
jgi:hypothetical protein